MKELITVADAAHRLAVHPATLRAWIREGKIHAYRIGGRFVRLSWDETLATLSRLDLGGPATTERSKEARINSAGAGEADRRSGAAAQEASHAS